MKSTLFRKDGLGAAVGRLSAPNRLKCDIGGHIKEFHLIGNVVDTKKYDVIVLGWLRGEDTLEVYKMESIAEKDDPNVGLKYQNEDGTDTVICLSVPNEKIEEVIQKHPENKSPYHVIKIRIRKDVTLYLTITGGYEPPKSESHIFLLRGTIASETKRINNAVNRTSRYAIGQQMLS